MIKDLTIATPVPTGEQTEEPEKFKNVREAIARAKRGPLPQDDIKLEDIPF